MNGLAAILCRDGRSIDRSVISAMLDAVPHRALDGCEVNVWQSVALGCAYTAVLPEDQPQPVISNRTGCALIADVRLDNRAELLAWIPDQTSHATSDAELVLRAYEAWGVDVFPRLLGDFAIVIWDPREQRMVCARDTSGQRNLFYRCDNHTFAAATEIQQLLQDARVPVEPDHERIRDSLVPRTFYRNVKDQARTYYKGIWCVPAGHVLTVDATDLRLHQYWEFTPPAEIRYATLDDYAEHFLSLFTTVLEDRLRTSWPVGATLSGGMDSSSIVSVAHEVLRKKAGDVPAFTSFSIVFPGLECDERPLIEMVQGAYGFNAVYIPRPTSDRLSLDSTVFQEMPDAGLAEVVAIYDAARREGVRTLLTGDIADACVGGDRYIYDSLLRRGNVSELVRSLRAHRRVYGGDRWLKLVTLYCLLPMAPLSLQRRVRLVKVGREFRRSRKRLVPSWMPQTLQEELLQRHVWRHTEEVRDQKFASPARQREYTLLYPPEAVSTLTGHAIDTVRPFADRRLHAFLLAVPPETKFLPLPDTDSFYAGSKRLLRHSMRGLLPEAIRTKRTKVVFNSVFEEEVRRHWGVYTDVFGPASMSCVAQYGYIDRDAFWARLEKMRAGEQLRDYSYIRTIVELESWLRGLANVSVVQNRPSLSERNAVVGEGVETRWSLAQLPV